MQYSALHNRTWKTPTVQKPCRNRAVMAYKTKKPWNLSISRHFLVRWKGLEPPAYWFVGTEWHILSISSFDVKTSFWSNHRYFAVVILLHPLHCSHAFAPVIHPCDVQKMCKSVQSQNQPGKTGCFAQPQKLDFNGIYCAKSSSFIQTTILHDTSVLWQGLGHPNRHRLI